MKKSIFKRWWFWLIIVIVFIVAIGSSGGDNTDVGQTPGTNPSINEPAPVPAPAQEADIWSKAGMYKVKPQAGALAYFEVTKDSTGSLTSIVTNDNTEAEKYITIGAGQYIKLNNCQLEK